MLIVTSLLFGISFLTQVVVLAAPLSLNGVSINARGFHNGPAGQATQADHSESAGRADPRPPRSPESLFSDDEKPGFVDKKHLAAKIVPYNYGSSHETLAVPPDPHPHSPQWHPDGKEIPHTA